MLHRALAAAASPRGAGMVLARSFTGKGGTNRPPEKHRNPGKAERSPARPPSCKSRGLGHAAPDPETRRWLEETPLISALQPWTGHDTSSPLGTCVQLHRQLQQGWGKEATSFATTGKAGLFEGGSLALRERAMERMGRSKHWLARELSYSAPHTASFPSTAEIRLRSCPVGPSS